MPRQHLSFADGGICNERFGEKGGKAGQKPIMKNTII